MIEKINVVVVNDFDYVQGGATKVALETAQLLYKQGINVVFFSAVHQDHNYPFRCVSTNQKEMIHDKNIFRGAVNNIYNKKVKKELAKLLRGMDRDQTIVHIHGWTKALSSSAFDVAYKLGFKVILTAHDYFTVCPNGGMYNYVENHICSLKPMSNECRKCNCDSRNMLFKKFRVIRQKKQNKDIQLLNKLDYLITISDFSEKILTRYFHPKHIYRVYNPTSIDHKESIIDVKNNKYFVFVGRITKEKGIEPLLDAFFQTDKNIKIIGDGPLKETLSQKYILNKNIEFMGWKSQNEVYEYMRNAKALLFPSLWFEGAPLTIFEAMSMGLPCLVSNKCSAIDFIENKVNGIIFNPDHINEIIDAINVSEEDLVQYSQKSYHDYWQNPYTKERYINNLLDVYQNVLEGDKK